MLETPFKFPQVFRAGGAARLVGARHTAPDFAEITPKHPSTFISCSSTLPMMRTNDPRPSPSPAPEEEPPTLLDLPIDVLNIITQYLFDALLPHHLTHLAETCATMNAAFSDALAAVQADHNQR